MGYRYGANCEDAEVPPGYFVNYFEVAYDKTSLKIKSAFANFSPIDSNDQTPGDSKIALFGERGPDDGTKGWFFSPTMQLIGLRGTETMTGIAAIGVIIYEEACAISAIEKAILLDAPKSSGSDL